MTPGSIVAQKDLIFIDRVEVLTPEASMEKHSSGMGQWVMYTTVTGE